MPIQITITIPDEYITRVKNAIDHRTSGEGSVQPNNAQEYKEWLINLIKRELMSFVKKSETVRQQDQISIDDISVIGG